MVVYFVVYLLRIVDFVLMIAGLVDCVDLFGLLCLVTFWLTLFGFGSVDLCWVAMFIVWVVGICGYVLLVIWLWVASLVGVLVCDLAFCCLLFRLAGCGFFIGGECWLLYFVLFALVFEFNCGGVWCLVIIVLLDWLESTFVSILMIWFTCFVWMVLDWSVYFVYLWWCGCLCCFVWFWLLVAVGWLAACILFIVCSFVCLHCYLCCFVWVGL